MEAYFQAEAKKIQAQPFKDPAFWDASFKYTFVSSPDA